MRDAIHPTSHIVSEGKGMFGSEGKAGKGVRGENRGRGEWEDKQGSI